MDYRDIYGWFYSEGFFDWVLKRLPHDRPSTLVEIGCWEGRGVAYLAGRVKEWNIPAHIYAVDNWVGSSCDETDKAIKDFVAQGKYTSLLAHFKKNMEQCGFGGLVTPIESDSADGAAHFADGSVDFAFIDADHRSEAVRRDILAWRPKIRSGGILAGHDYDRESVSTPVKELLPGHRTGDPYCWLYEVSGAG